MANEEKKDWSPKLGELVLWSPPYQDRGLLKAPRRVLVFAMTSDGNYRIRVSPSRFRIVKRETLSRIGPHEIVQT